MKLWRPLTLPGYALSKNARYVTLAALGVLGVVLFSASSRVDTLRWMLTAAYGWAAMNAFLWVFLANTVLLARDGRALRLPGLQRDALTSICFYGVLAVALPALLLGWIGGHLLLVTIMLLFGAGIGACYALLPSYLAVFTIFAPRIPAALSPWLPQPMEPGFNAWAGAAVALLWLGIAWRIRGLVHGDHSLQPPHAPLLMTFRQKVWGVGSAGPGNRRGQRTPGQGPAWTRPKVDLRGCGPGHAERSLRVTLGGWWMPQTWPSRLWQCALLLAGLSLGALIVLMQVAADHHARTPNPLTDFGGAGNVVFFGTLMSAILAINTVRSLYRRWGSNSAELPLLAVLPGLGEALAVRRALLRASLLPSLGLQLGLALLLLILAGAMHMGSEGEVLVLFGPLGSAGLMCAFALVVFGADPVRGWGMALAMGAGYVWVCVSGTIVQFSAAPVVALSDAALLALATGWSVFFVFLLWLGRRGWRAFQQRPHPFLAN